MILKDRQEAGLRLAAKVAAIEFENPVIISILRGGVAVGAELSVRLNIPHLALPVAKMASPYNPELAVGAWCFGERYFDQTVLATLDLSASQIRESERAAQERFKSYLSRFEITQTDFQQHVPATEVILVDDGIATGATMHAAARYIMALNPQTLTVCAPVAPRQFEYVLFDRLIVLERVDDMTSVSAYYQSFPQLEDTEVTQLLAKASPF